MALVKPACALLIGLFALFATLAVLQGSEIVTTWAGGPAHWRSGRRLTQAGQSATSSVQMAVRKLGATLLFGGLSTKQSGGIDTPDEVNHEDDIAMELAEAEARVAQWRLQSAEDHLVIALHRAESWLLDSAKDNAPRQQRERASRKTIEVLTGLGRFLEARGRPEEAVVLLQRAEELAVSLAPPSPHAVIASAEDTIAVARAQAALGRALCVCGGKEGTAFLGAKRTFRSAIEAVAEAQAGVGEGNAHLLTPLAADIHVDLAECLHDEGDLAAARSQVDEATRIAESDLGGSMSPQFRQRLARVRGGVVHDEGKFDDALHLYNEYLQAVGSSLNALPHPNIAGEMFGAMQDIVLATSSKGQVHEALVALDDVERLQQAANAELQAKGQRRDKFLRKDIIDRKLWASMARTHVVRAELLLEESRVAKKAPARAVLSEAQAAVTMLRRTGDTAYLENALNTLGNVLITLGKQKSAETAYRESLTSAEHRHGTSSPLVAALYHNLGSVVELRGEVNVALELYRKAYDIQIKTIGFENPDTAGSLTSIAESLEKQGKLTEAAATAARAAESTRFAYPVGHWMRIDADERAARFETLARPANEVVTVVVEA